MTTENDNPSADAAGPGPGDGNRSNQAGNNDIQRVQHNPVSARVPDEVSRGVFSNGVLVITGGSEFVLDFVARLGRPHQVVARVIVPHAVMPRIIDAIKQAIEKYTARFGAPPALPKPPEPGPNDRRPSIQEIYDDLKIPDDVLSGSYANAIMIGHTPAEFGLDFLTNFFPNAAVSCRVYLAAAQAPRVLDSLNTSYEQLRKRAGGQGGGNAGGPNSGPEGQPRKPDDGMM